jgi:elongation factor Ts
MLTKKKQVIKLMSDSKELVKQLRQMTGAGILDCKKYLDKANNNIDQAIKLFRSEAGVKADKKGSRIAAEGIVNYYQNDKNIIILELNSETDFVARDSNFIKLAESIANKLLENDESEVINEISDEISSIISKLGENIKLRRFTKVNKNNYIYGYTHNNKIASIVELKKENDSLAKDICMQIVASNPLALNEASIDSSTILSEKEIYKKELENIDKKDDIKRNILEGKMKKFINDNTLLNQPFVKDPSTSLSKIIKDNEIISFTRYEVGEGIEKKSEDFAQEVYNQIS